jgi:hypothetical protein
MEKRHEANIDYTIRKNLESVFSEDHSLGEFRVENQPTTASGIADLKVYRDLEVFIIFENKKTDVDADNLEVHRRAREYALELTSRHFVVSNIHHTYLYRLGVGHLSNNLLKFWNNGNTANIKEILVEMMNICLGITRSDNNWFNFLVEYKKFLLTHTIPFLLRDKYPSNESMHCNRKVNEFTVNCR